LSFSFCSNTSISDDYEYVSYRKITDINFVPKRINKSNLDDSHLPIIQLKTPIISRNKIKKQKATSDLKSLKSTTNFSIKSASSSSSAASNSSHVDTTEFSSPEKIRAATNDTIIEKRHLIYMIEKNDEKSPTIQNID
jgi:hypothetical protein